MRLATILCCIIILLTGCTRRLVEPAESSSIEVSVNGGVQETVQERYAGLIGSKLCWVIPDGFASEQTDDGFLLTDSDREIGISVIRRSLWEVDYTYASGVSLPEDAFQSKLPDMLSLFEDYEIDNTVKVVIDGQQGYLCSGSYKGDRSLRLLCMQFGSDIIALAGTAPEEFEKELDDAVGDVKVARTIFTTWEGD